MAEPENTTAAAPAEPCSNKPETDNPNSLPDPPPQHPSSTPPPNTNPNPSTPPRPPTSLIAPPPPIQPYAAAGSAAFRLPTPPLPQFSHVPPNPNLPQAPTYHTPPPGVNAVPQPPLAAPGQVPVPSLPYPPGGQVMRQQFMPMPNGYPAIHQHSPQGVVPPPGLCYPSPYAPMVRPAYPPRPGVVPVVPPLLRPPVTGLRAPIIPPIVRPAVLPSISQTEKAQTTVYVGKIASTVENDFILSLLQLCGVVKSWKRPQDPTNGTLKGYGFCEFESAEGLLRALRLLSKLNIDGQELMLNVNQATREYLEHYVQKKVESSKHLKETETETIKQDEGDESGDKRNGTPNSSMESPKLLKEETEKADNKTADKENSDVASFGLVNDEDRQADQEAFEKLTGMIEERLKNKPLPPPPAQTAADNSANSDLEVPSRSKDGELDAETTKDDTAEDKNDNEMTIESKPSGEQDKSEASSPDRRHDRRSRDRERDVKREKERELERYEREREQERAKREKEREYRFREDERRCKAREKEWESREKEREHWRKREKEREKERAEDRKWDVTAQERESDDGYSKKRKYRIDDEERRRRQREKEEDLADRLKEEEEVAEYKRRAEEELQKKQQEEELKLLSEHSVNGSGDAVLSDETNVASADKSIEQTSDEGEGIMQNGIGDESVVASFTAPDVRNNNNAPARKLGFGLQGSGKRTAVPSVFNQDEDDDTQKEKKMRPLVPIDYSADEQMAVQPLVSEAPTSNLVAAAEFARRISSVTVKEEKPDIEKERSRRSHDRHTQRDRDRGIDEISRARDEIKKENVDRDRVREHGSEKVKAQDSQKLLDAKQLIDMIPKTKDELFSYEINWETYDRNALHERMKPWISKKITEFLGEEEPTLVDYIMSSTREHVKAADMLERLQGILDEEAEMFVLKMWRMLIFEVKKVETGLALKSRS